MGLLQTPAIAVMDRGTVLRRVRRHRALSAQPACHRSSPYIFVFLARAESFLPSRWAVAAGGPAAGGSLLLLDSDTGVQSQCRPDAALGGGQLFLLQSLEIRSAALVDRARNRWRARHCSSKYSTALLLLAIFEHCVSTRSARGALLTAGPYVAIIVCLVLISPHLVWLVHARFPTLQYAVGAEFAGNETSIAARIAGAVQNFYWRRLLT